MIKEYYEDIDKYRNVRITSLLGISGNNRKVCTRCPFHSEKTPSFWIYEDNSYFCFGCRASGQNAVDFCVGLGATFGEAKEELRKYI